VLKISSKFSLDNINLNLNN